jgi:hypothetical protein
LDQLDRETDQLESHYSSKTNLPTAHFSTNTNQSPAALNFSIKEMTDTVKQTYEDSDMTDLENHDTTTTQP